jgi:D-alanine-D-alanine ligase
MSKKPRIGVVFGGRSSEHEVSLTSARAVMAALDPEKYEIVPIGITREGRWLWGDDPLLVLEQEADRGLLNREPQPGIVAPSGALARTARRLPGESSPVDQLDVIIPVLHGLRGEDGTIQGMLELGDVAYVGCGVLASAVGMDKGMMKAAFAAVGLPQVPYILVRRGDWRQNPDEVIHQIEATLPYPVFTKPANAGSSVGVAKCRDRHELRSGLELAARHDRRLIVEQGLAIREIEVAVLGNDEPEASVCGEVVPANEWYDYADKYLEGQTQLLIPAPLDPLVSDRIRRMAVDAFKAIDGSGLARVDFLLEKETGMVFVNEVNTFPGFTAGSMYPKLWAATGLPYSALLDRLIELAIERHQDQREQSGEAHA